MIKTVADLRRALDAYPDDMPVKIFNSDRDVWGYVSPRVAIPRACRNGASFLMIDDDPRDDENVFRLEQLRGRVEDAVKPANDDLDRDFINDFEAKPYHPGSVLDYMTLADIARLAETPYDDGYGDEQLREDDQA